MQIIVFIPPRHARYLTCTRNRRQEKKIEIALVREAARKADAHPRVQREHSIMMPPDYSPQGPRRSSQCGTNTQHIHEGLRYCRRAPKPAGSRQQRLIVYDTDSDEQGEALAVDRRSHPSRQCVSSLVGGLLHLVDNASGVV